ncbi:SLC13 family permease [Haloarcula japonica]|uniref:Sodium/sulfate symporter n=1 Tax=Haloarcula japonica (strain ATCC 49778 / DSM 6131 / JCM 7785 / NBRC 101032 / NCIMB 13157 / TR-1) TaxID=1227453 RepID=M0L1W8_HALJT|nr:SLC13 family permease [Haloarcula japonica]EMA27083.1 sodium/sulfate symporter [Haloarcula japonica DSM 6131]
MGDGRTDGTGLLADVPVVQVSGLVVMALLLGGGLAGPTPPGMSPSIRRVLSVFLIALVLWLTEPVPYVVSSVLSVTLLYALGVVDTFAAAATGYASSLVFFLLLLLLLSNSISSVGLDRRMAQRLLSGEHTPRQTHRSLAAHILLLAVLVPSAMARAVTFIPIVKRLVDAYGLADGSGFERGAFLLLGHVNPIASMALMTGGGMALVTSEIVTSTVRPVTWVEWAVLMIPPTVALFGLGTVSAAAFSSVDGEKTVATADGNGAPAEEPRPFGTESASEVGSTREQRLVAGVMGATVLAWIVGSFVGIPTVVPAAAAVFVLSLPGVGVIKADDVRDVSWGIIFLIGAMLSILDVMESTGTLDYVVETLTRAVPFAALAHWQVVAVLLGLAVGIRVLFSTASAAIVVALPIVLEFADAFGVARLPLALSVLLVVGSTTILPFNTSAVLVSMDRGPLSHRDVVSFGLVTMALSLVVVVASWLVYWPVILSCC